MTKKEKICKTCGKSFTGHHKALYCSPECIPKRSHKKKPTKPTKAAPPPEVPAPDTVPPTEITVPLNGDVLEDKGESEKKPFRKFFYD